MGSRGATRRVGVYWSKVVYPDGREEWLYPPGPSKDRAYKAVLKHKFDMQNGGEVGG